MKKPGRFKLVLLALGVWLFCCSSTELGYRAWLFVYDRYPDNAAAFDLYGVGESTMNGEPYQERFSLPDLVSAELNGQVAVNGGNKPVRVRLLATRGESVYPQAVKFERAVAFRNRRNPGAVLIYCGHNDRIVSSGDAEEPATWVESLERSFPFDHSWAVRDLLFRLRSRNVLRTVHNLESYEFNLRRIVADARAAGLTPLLFTLPSNLSGTEPNAPDDAQLRDVISKGAALEKDGQLRQAIELYRANEAFAPPTGVALLAYREGRCEAQLTENVDAMRDFHRAVDNDSRFSFGRTTTAQNDLIRTLASAAHVGLIDAAAKFDTYGVHVDSYFSDGQHPNLQGYAVLAAEAAQQLARQGTKISQEANPLDRFHLDHDALGAAHRTSGAWLLANSVQQPPPFDRLTQAEWHFRQALGTGDDMTSVAGMALAQAGRNGMFVDEKSVALLSRNGVWYSTRIQMPATEWNAFLSVLEKFHADPDTLRQLRLLQE